MTAVKTPDWRTARIATTQPSTYSAAKAVVSSLPDPASKAKPAAVPVTATTTAAHQGTPGMLGIIEQRSAATADRVRSADTRRPYRLSAERLVKTSLAARGRAIFSAVGLSYTCDPVSL